MTKLAIRWTACLIVVLFWWFVAVQVFAADLAVPKRVIPTPKAHPVAAAPLPKPKPVIEECLGPTVTPSMKQTLQTDDTCPGKLRWKNSK
jgi:hypothetical protein